MERRAVSAAAECFWDMLRLYLRAYQAATPIEAQSLGDQAQKKIDEAVIHKRDAEAELATYSALEKAESLGALAAASVTATLSDWGCVTPLELDTVAREAFSALTGTSTANDLAIEYAVTRSMAKSSMNVERLDTVVANVHKALADNPGVLQSLAEDSEYVTDTRDRVDDFRSALFAIYLVIKGSKSERIIAGELVQLMGRLYDGPGHLVLSTTLLATGIKTRSYSKMRHDDMTELHARVRLEQHLSWIWEGLDEDVRVAWAHSKVKYGAESVVFERRSGTKGLSYPELIDCALALVEVVAGGLVAIQAGLRTVGVEIGGWDPLDDLSPQERVTVGAQILVGDGATVEVALSAGPPRVVIRGEVRGNLRTIAGSLTTYLESDEERLEVIFVNAGDRYVMDAAAYRQWRAEQDDELRQLHFVNGLLLSTYNGEPMMSVSDVRAFVAKAASEHLNADDLGASISVLRRYRKAALIFGDQQIHDVLTGTVKCVREWALGGDPDTTHFETFRAWSERSIALEL